MRIKPCHMCKHPFELEGTAICRRCIGGQQQSHGLSIRLPKNSKFFCKGTGPGCPCCR